MLAERTYTETANPTEFIKLWENHVILEDSDLVVPNLRLMRRD